MARGKAWSAMPATLARKDAAKRCRQFWVAPNRSGVKVIDDREIREIFEELEHAKAPARSEVEYRFLILRRQFICLKARYKALAKGSGGKDGVHAGRFVDGVQAAAPADIGSLRPQ